MNRRHFLQATLATSTLLTTTSVWAKPKSKMQICVFSKQLQWADSYQHMAEIAAEIGFDGIDLTVRPGGHVLPERVTDDLPKAHEAIRKAGLALPMIVTHLTKADSEAENILKTAASLGVRYYRTGNYYYKPQTDILSQLRQFNVSLKELSLLSQKYKIAGCYQNHASIPPTFYVGAAIWDLKELLTGINPDWMGVQYDINHATAEGGDNWPINLQLIAPYVRTFDIKDFYWDRKEGKRFKHHCALGEGTVDFKTYLPLAKKYQFTGPVSMHFEQSLGGAENGNRTLTIDKKEVIAAMKKDLHTLRTWLAENGF
ncbi:sugar phosphate isomerase/epimerase family protein [Xanthocytophaga agilis]|uniref:Sugar phosphate isomerase/epimerase family protein n=1 Tax=Xanthocytophaga agilis TaxID=3048010 RepID=A0AAE3UFR4_9BACT|nr:sugar phosphate isomerase/epimerase family protein [Xanthocytophaga agilis]MDJ1504133.1 sugar phosphate isomerase/epimerase family protein [Xanthocytophaga agilis]